MGKRTSSPSQRPQSIEPRLAHSLGGADHAPQLRQVHAAVQAIQRSPKPGPFQGSNRLRASAWNSSGSPKHSGWNGTQAPRKGDCSKGDRVLRVLWCISGAILLGPICHFLRLSWLGSCCDLPGTPLGQIKAPGSYGRVRCPNRRWISD